MLPKATWPPTTLEELDRTVHGAQPDWGTDKKWTEGEFHPATDDELDDLVSKFEWEQWLHAH